MKIICIKPNIKTVGLDEKYCFSKQFGLNIQQILIIIGILFPADSC